MLINTIDNLLSKHFNYFCELYACIKCLAVTMYILGFVSYFINVTMIV